MPADLTNPSVGLNATSGLVLTGWDHVLQSLSDIFTTGFGERIIREWYGSFVPSRNSCSAWRSVSSRTVPTPELR